MEIKMNHTKEKKIYELGRRLGAILNNVAMVKYEIELIEDEVVFGCCSATNLAKTFADGIEINTNDFLKVLTALSEEQVETVAE